MDCGDLKSLVLHWIGQELECRSIGPDSLVATFPLLKPNGDAIEIGIQSTGRRAWKLSDLGDTHATLYLAGVDLLEEYVRGEEFRQIIQAHKIRDAEDELSVDTTSDNLAESMFDFAHAIQSALALQLTVKTQQPKRDFPSIVAKFLGEQRTAFEIPTEDVEGKTGRWKFDFVLNHVREETLVKALSARSRTGALHLAEESVFEIGDVRELRAVKAVVIADDEGKRQSHWQDRELAIFKGYDVPVYAFEGNRKELLQFALEYRLRET